MKKLLNGSNGSNIKNVNTLPSLSWFNLRSTSLYYLFVLFAALLFTACRKESVNENNNQPEVPGKQTQTSTISNSNMKSDAEFINMYRGLSKQTTLELQQARAATARYRNIENAIKDGYTNIGVDVPNMGHHYMNPSLVDGTFDIRKPEILVYNGNADGSFDLVAVEYAIPLSNPLPEGFTGSADVWNGTSGFPLWLVHAWVWSYNPDGVFNWTNPLIDLH
jgi:hypothetical protein